MRNLIASAMMAAASVCCAVSAQAADLGPYRGVSMKDSPPVDYRRPFSWSGFYIGAQVGYAWGNTEAESGPFATYNQSYNYNSDGWVGGGHAGYNWQRQNLVFGIETDIEAASLSGSGTGSLGNSHTTDLNWLGSLRGRLGIAYDRTLFYATAGWAYGDVSIDKGFASYSDVRSGWTVGGGIEQAISDRMTMRLEYRYTDLGSSDFASAAVNSVDKSDLDFHTVRAGVSFKF